MKKITLSMILCFTALFLYACGERRTNDNNKENGNGYPPNIILFAPNEFHDTLAKFNKNPQSMITVTQR